MSNFNVLQFIADHAGEDMITALCKAYSMGKADGIEEENKKNIDIIHSFFKDEVDKLPIEDDGHEDLLIDTKKMNEILAINKRLCDRIKANNKNKIKGMK